MAIPNTTPTPNELYNSEMKKMTDTELRVVLIVTRATLGWEIDKETKMRKKEDWISHYQLIEKSGRSGRAISTAIDRCIKQGWIEARDKEGNILNTKEKRIGKRIFYRLGNIFLNKIKTSEESSEVLQTSEKSSIEKSSIYKRNTNTKDNDTKVSQKPVEFGNQDINNLIQLLKEEYDIKILDGSEKENRRYCWLALKKFKRAGLEAIIRIGARDKFWQTKITGFKTLYYNGVKIASTLREKQNQIVKI